MQETQSRGILLGRISEGLARADIDTLREVERLLARRPAPTAPSPPPRPAPGRPVPQRPAGPATSRRVFLGTLTVGGVALVASGAAAGWQALEAQAQRELVEQYRQLEAGGLDATISNGLAAVESGMNDLDSAASTLRSALDLTEGRWQSFDDSLPAIREGLSWLQATVARLSEDLQPLGEAVAAALGLSGPLQETLGPYISRTIDATGEQAGTFWPGLELIGAQIAGLEELLEGIQTGVLAPLAAWFSDDPATALESSLVEPVRTQLFPAARAIVNTINPVCSAWEGQLAVPVRALIDERAAIRGRIAQLSDE